MKRQFLILAAGAAALGLPVYGFAASITPASFAATIGVGETVSVDKTITTDAGGASKVDVFFLADNTGSMGGIVNTAQARASDILNASDFSGRDIGFGVGGYFGDPSEFFSGTGGDSAYDVLQPITTDKSAVQTGINGWRASGGGDTPEANLYALQQAASEGAAGTNGVSSGEATGWRPGSQRIVAWFGDAPGHQDTVDLNESISALTDAGVTVVAFNNGSAGFGIDSGLAGGTGDSRDQASAIVDATGGSLVNNFRSLGGDAFVDAIVDAITTASATLDLIFDTSGDLSGLDVAFTCTDPLGCTDVSGGESRTFRMDVAGVSPGTYDFTVFARGVGAVETDRIAVTTGGGPASVPEPSTVLLLGVGLAGLGVLRRYAGRQRS